MKKGLSQSSHFHQSSLRQLHYSYWIYKVTFSLHQPFQTNFSSFQHVLVHCPSLSRSQIHLHLQITRTESAEHQRSKICKIRTALTNNSRNIHLLIDPNYQSDDFKLFGFFTLLVVSVVVAAIGKIKKLTKRKRRGRNAIPVDKMLYKP